MTTSPQKALLLQGPLIFGAAVMLTTFVGGTVLARTFSINGAVVAPGIVIVDGRPKQVQHPEGGLVAEIRVDDGVAVKEGDVVIRLDDTQIKANFGVVVERISKLRASIARLRAERDGLAKPEFAEPESDGDREATATELAQFIARRDALIGKKNILNQQISQFELLIEGIKAEIDSIDEMNRIATLEYGKYKELYEKHLEPITRLLQLEREKAGLLGRRGDRVANLAKTQDEISETRLKIIQADTEFRASVLKDLADAEAQLRELNERRVAAQDRLDQIEIKAPQSGIVQDMTVFTVGGVISQGQSLMRIVPNTGHLVIEGHVNQQDIDQVHNDQTAIVRFTNFNRRLTPELNATVTRVSADIADTTALEGRKPRGPGGPSSASTAAPPYYAVRIEIPDDELGKLEGAKLVAGMVVETMIMTDERTVFSYLFKPVTDRMALAFRER